MSNTNFPTGDLQIRPASYSDIPFIRKIALETWPSAYGDILTPDQLQYMLEKFYSTEALEQCLAQNHYYFLALKHYSPIGFASFTNEENGVYKLQRLYVLPTVQKTGAGQKLLETVKSVSKSMGGITLKLNVNRKNPARSFYERNGFVVVSSEDIPIGNGYFMNDYIMSLSLNGDPE